MLLRTTAEADPLRVLLRNGRIRQWERGGSHRVQIGKPAFLQSLDDERVLLDGFVGAKYFAGQEWRVDFLHFLPRDQLACSQIDACFEMSFLATGQHPLRAES